jgi:hypothetical protein
MKDFISMVGHDLEDLGIPEYMDGRDHQVRLNWFFKPVGLEPVDTHFLYRWTVKSFSICFV